MTALVLAPAWRKASFGNFVWLMFALAQAADGVLSYVGIATYGTSIEGNPLLACCIAAAGVTIPLVAAKTFALACGAFLHVHSMHSAVAILTALYLAAAVWPWAVVLWPLI